MPKSILVDWLRLFLIAVAVVIFVSSATTTFAAEAAEANVNAVGEEDVSSKKSSPNQQTSGVLLRQ